LRKFIASRDKSDSESTTKKKQLTIFLKTAQTMIKFPEVDLAQTKREIFNILTTIHTYDCKEW
jgi:hypothetical protein